MSDGTGLEGIACECYAVVRQNAEKVYCPPHAKCCSSYQAAPPITGSEFHGARLCSINDSAILSELFLCRSLNWNETRLNSDWMETGHAPLFFQSHLRKTHPARRRRCRIAEPVRRRKRGIGGDPRPFQIGGRR